MTNKQRKAYTVKLRAFAERMRNEGDLVSAEFNEWMADNYAMTYEKYKKIT